MPGAGPASGSGACQDPPDALMPLLLASRRRSALLDDARAGDQVLPATASLVDEDPDVADVEHGPRDPQSDETQQGGPPPEPATVAVADDAEVERSHPERRAAASPEEREVQDRDDRPDDEDDRG